MPGDPTAFGKPAPWSERKAAVGVRKGKSESRAVFGEGKKCIDKAPNNGVTATGGEQWSTTFGSGYGVQQEAYKQERFRKAGGIVDDAITSTYSTTQSAIGSGIGSPGGPNTSKAELVHMRSRVQMQTHSPWTTTQGQIGENHEIRRKPLARKNEEYFPKGPVQYATAQSDIGAHCSDRGSATSSRASSSRRRDLKPAEPDPWKRTSDQYGATSGFAADTKKKTKDILGAVDLQKEKVLTENQAQEAAYSGFLISSDAKAVPKAVEVPEGTYPKSTSYKIRKELAKLNM